MWSRAPCHPLSTALCQKALLICFAVCTLALVQTTIGGGWIFVYKSSDFLKGKNHFMWCLGSLSLHLSLGAVSPKNRLSSHGKIATLVNCSKSFFVFIQSQSKVAWRCNTVGRERVRANGRAYKASDGDTAACSLLFWLSCPYISEILK